MKLKCIIFPAFLILCGTLNAQLKKDSTTVKKFTPYELLSSYYNKDFKPFKKGNKYFGFSMSLEDRQSENTENIFQKILDGNRANFNLLLTSGYYISDYGMVGLNFNVYQNKFEGVLMQDDDNLESKTITRGFSITPNYRITIPLTANERLSFFTTLGLTLGKSNTLKRDIKNLDEIEKKFIENYNFKAGISPGVSFFAMENFAMEVQLDVLGYELNVEDIVKNDVEKSHEVRNNVDFKLNFLSVKVGLAYYIMNKKR